MDLDLLSDYTLMSALPGTLGFAVFCDACAETPAGKKTSSTAQMITDR